MHIMVVQYTQNKIVKYLSDIPKFFPAVNKFKVLKSVNIIKKIRDEQKHTSLRCIGYEIEFKGQ